jgi:sphinganine C4-monooxygenase
MGIDQDFQHVPAFNMPPLPDYTLSPKPDLIPGMPDYVLQMVAITVAYWVVSGIFHVIDEWDLFPQYRLHTPVEIAQRNKVTRYEVVRDVVIQQIVQGSFGIFLAYFDPPETIGKEDYDSAVWSLRIRAAQQYVPAVLGFCGINSTSLAAKLYATSPALAGILGGGRYVESGFAAWELLAGKAIYWVGIPLLQFTIGAIYVDTWQYFLHRAMHMNKFLYTWLHARHHRLYVPYAYGALYNHPIEGFMLDTLGTGVAYLVTGMTVRQGMCFFTLATIKTVDDHCGYKFPWDPMQRISSNNAAYHDIHHQSWGIKSNFSQPFFTFWDRFLGTTWTGGDVSARYQRGRIGAQAKADAQRASVAPSVTNSPAIDPQKAVEQAAASRQQVYDDPEVDGDTVLAEERREELEARQQAVRRSRRSTGGFDPKAISDRVSSSLHGRSSAILHADGLR